MATVLLLHCDGTNGSTTFTDETGKTVTANGNAQISTAQSKFGGASALLDGAGDYLSLAASSDWGFGTADFTVEAWINSSTTGAYADFIGQFQTGTPSGKWDIKTRFSSTNNVVFTYHTGSSYVDIQCSPAVNVNDSSWHHIAVCRTGGNINIFVDGVLKNTTAISGSQPIGLSGNTLLIGYDPTDGAYYTGYLDEIRITKGEAIYTANFTPPSSAFTLPTITGVVSDDTGANAARTVRLYKRSDGSLVASTTSNGTTGVYTFNTGLPVIPTEHYVVCLDDASGTQYNALILDKVVPG